MHTFNPEFEKLVLNELRKQWTAHAHKWKWIQRGMLTPVFQIFDRQDRLGQWSNDDRVMSFSRSLVTDRPWSEVIEVLKHEMAHQYVFEMLHVLDEAPHGKTFYLVCDEHNIDAARCGTPGSDKVDATGHIVEKVKRLLALSKSDNENEARVAAERARELMLKHNIEVEEKQEGKEYTVRFLGELTGRIQGYMSELAALLSKYYFVEVIWIGQLDPRSDKSGHELEISGTTENVEAAEYVYEFLMRSAVESWEKKFADPAFKLELHKSFAATYGYGDAPQTVRGFTISARSNYLIGFIRGFKEQLKQAEIKEQAAGLVLARDIELEEFYHKRHPHIRKLAGGGRFRNAHMQNQGFADGKSLQITPGMQAPKKHVPLLGK